MRDDYNKMKWFLELKYKFEWDQKKARRNKRKAHDVEKNAMKILFTIGLVIFIGVSNVFATAQYPDKIIYENKEYELHSNPLEPYFEKHPDKRLKREIKSTALWRGYVATFEIKDAQLVLKDIEIEVSDNNKARPYLSHLESVRKICFPGKEIIGIEWVTGILLGYGSTCGNYILLEIENGQLRAERKLNHEEYREFKERQLQEFRKTEEYEKLVADMKKEGWSQERINAFLRDFVIWIIHEFGKVSK